MGKSKVSLRAKLSRSEQFQVCVWLAEMKTYTQVADLIDKTFNKQLNKKSIWEMAMRPRWSKIVRRMHTRMTNNLLDIPIANKSVRLEYLAAIYRSAMTERVVKLTRDGEIWDVDRSGAAKATEAARKELEGEGISIHTDKLEMHNHLTLSTIIKQVAKEDNGVIDNNAGEEGLDSEKPRASNRLAEQDLGDLNIL